MSAAVEVVLSQHSRAQEQAAEPTHFSPLAQVIPLRSERPNPQEHLDLVYSAVGRLKTNPRYLERTELVNIAVVGLLEAASRYHSTLGVPFRAYAEHRIKGALLDAFRSADWVGRTTRRRLGALRAAEHRLSQTLGQSPDQETLCEALQLTPEKLGSLRNKTHHPEIYLEDCAPDDAPWEERFSHDSPSPLDSFSSARSQKDLRRAIQGLPAREQEVIRLSFFEERTLKEIGLQLGVTEARACQLRNQGLTRLRSVLSN